MITKNKNKTVWFGYDRKTERGGSAYRETEKHRNDETG